jgi:hypothetical protein
MDMHMLDAHMLPRKPGSSSSKSTSAIFSFLRQGLIAPRPTLSHCAYTPFEQQALPPPHFRGAKPSMKASAAFDTDLANAAARELSGRLQLP